MKAILLDARSPKVQVVDIDPNQFDKMCEHMLRHKTSEIGVSAASICVDDSRHGETAPVYVHFIQGGAARRESRDMSRHTLCLTGPYRYDEGPIWGSVIITGRDPSHERDYATSYNLGLTDETVRKIMRLSGAYETPRRGVFGQLRVADVDFHRYFAPWERDPALYDTF